MKGQCGAETIAVEKRGMVMRKIVEAVDLAALGGAAYGLIEILWRGYTHWSMVLLGGGLFFLLGKLNDMLPERMSLWRRGLIGGGVITAAEFAAGCVLNLRFGLAIWDYSAVPTQVLGQICLPYSAMWMALSMLASVLYRGIDRLAWQNVRA